jgi:class 3 adenylate cyclase
MEEFITGTRAAADPDRTLATVMFTDIVGSTELAAELGDVAWRDLLQRHDDLVREHLASFRGREVKHTGDGFLAVFDAPARAVQCADAIVTAVHDLDIRVRAGLHCGECELRGDDVGGVAVHIGARIGGLAGADEVLVSGTLHDLLLGSSIAFADRGTHVLKGVPGEWRVFALAGEPQVPPLTGDLSRLSRPQEVVVSVGRRAPALGRFAQRLIRR